MQLALRSVLRQGRRTMIAIIGVSFGVMVLIEASGFIEYLMRGLRESTIRGQLGHVQVVKPGYIKKGSSDPFAFLISGKDDVLRQIEAMPGVEAVAPRLQFTGLVSKGDVTISFLGQGVSPAREDVIARSEYTTVNISQGKGLDESATNEVIIGRGLATNLGVKVGESVVLLVNTPSGGINAVEVRVRGLFFSVAKAFDDSAIRVPLKLAHQLLKADGAHQWIVVLKDTGETDNFLARLDRTYAGQGLEFVPWYDLAEFYNKTRELFSSQVGVVKLIIAVIIVLSISNTLSMSVLERTSEIGTCMALGMQRYRILRLYIFEGLMLGLVGGAVGVIAGLLLAALLSYVGIPMPPPPGSDKGFSAEILITAPIVFGAFALAVVTTLMSSVLPALKASRLEIVEALRHNR
ncbi:MAG TPA: FtsX-like permease family protein [Methyloversatilis sp.]